jgi:hypothetical protein
MRRNAALLIKASGQKIKAAEAAFLRPVDIQVI